MSDIGKHSKNPGYKAGEHWNTCQRCGFDIYASDTRKEWTGLMVCKACWEPRHPQDFVRGIKEDTSAKGLVTSDVNKSPDAIIYDQEQATIYHTPQTAIYSWPTDTASQRDITIDSSGTYRVGDLFYFYRTGGGDVIDLRNDSGGLIRRLLPTVAAMSEVRYDGTDWVESAYTTL